LLSNHCNPGDLASRLLESEVEVLNANGAPAAEKTFRLYNPPVVNRALGIRRSYINESSRVAAGIPETRSAKPWSSRTRACTRKFFSPICSRRIPGCRETENYSRYRGGYLPNERREIERGLRDGKVRGVVSTSALELGIDVGSLDTIVMAGYPAPSPPPGQRAGRAGRRSGSSCAVLVASSSPLDQIHRASSDYFFGKLRSTPSSSPTISKSSSII